MQVCELLQLPQPPLLFEFRGVCSRCEGRAARVVGRSCTALLARLHWRSSTIAWPWPCLASRRHLTPRSWFLMRTLEAFTGGAEAQPRAAVKLDASRAHYIRNQVQFIIRYFSVGLCRSGSSECLLHGSALAALHSAQDIVGPPKTATQQRVAPDCGLLQRFLRRQIFASAIVGMANERTHANAFAGEPSTV